MITSSSKSVIAPEGAVFLLRSAQRKESAHVEYQIDGRNQFIRRVRGDAMATLALLTGEFVAACQLWDDTGDNWNAIEESLFHLDDLWIADSYAIVVSRSHRLLEAEPVERVHFYRMAHAVQRWWNTPIDDNPPFNRPAKPFVFVLEGTQDGLEVHERALSNEGVPTAWL